MLNYQPVVFSADQGGRIVSKPAIIDKLHHSLSALVGGGDRRLSSTIKVSRVNLPDGKAALLVSGGHLEGFATSEEWQTLELLVRVASGGAGADGKSPYRLIGGGGVTEAEVMSHFANPVEAANLAVDVAHRERDLFNADLQERLRSAMSVITHSHLRVVVPPEARVLSDVRIEGIDGSAVISGDDLRQLLAGAEVVERLALDDFLHPPQAESARMFPPTRAFAMARVLDLYVRVDGETSLISPPGLPANQSRSMGAYPTLQEGRVGDALDTEASPPTGGPSLG